MLFGTSCARDVASLRAYTALLSLTLSNICSVSLPSAPPVPPPPGSPPATGAPLLAGPDALPFALDASLPTCVGYSPVLSNDWFTFLPH